MGGEVRIRVDLRRGSGGSGEGIRCLRRVVGVDIISS